MSSGSWFRDYVYILLGGNHDPKFRWLINIFVVWFLTGFWHGASWNFIVWGLYFAVILVVEKFWLQKYISKTGFFQHVYVLLLVCISFVIFNAVDMLEAFQYIAAMFGAGEVPIISKEAVYYLVSYLGIFVIAFVGATPALKSLYARLCRKEYVSKTMNILEPIVMAVLLLLCTAYLVDGSFNPFLYFRF